MQRPHPAAPADGDLLRPGREGQCVVLERKPGSDTPWTKELWIYDLRTNKHFTLKTRTLTRADLDDFFECYKHGQRGKREERERFHRFSYDELVARDKASLDIFWLRDESLEEADNLPPPGVIAAEIVEDLRPPSPSSPSWPTPFKASVLRSRARRLATHG